MIDDDDSALLRKQQAFLQRIEFELRRINRQIIHRDIPDLSRQSFVQLAQFVAEERSRYLQLGLSLSVLPNGSPEAESMLDQLARARRSFKESREAFVALERAIQQGYVDIQT